MNRHTAWLLIVLLVACLLTGCAGTKNRVQVEIINAATSLPIDGAPGLSATLTGPAQVWNCSTGCSVTLDPGTSYTLTASCPGSPTASVAFTGAMSHFYNVRVTLDAAGSCIGVVIQ